MRGFLIGLFVLFSARMVGAQTLIKQAQSGSIVGLAAVPCTALSSLRTFTLNDNTLQGFAIMETQIDFTRQVATALTMICEVSLTNRTTWAQAQYCDIAPATGVCTLRDALWNKDVSGVAPGNVKSVPIRVDLLGAPAARCTVSCVAGGVTDLITTTIRLSAQ